MAFQGIEPRQPARQLGISLAGCITDDQERGLVVGDRLRAEEAGELGEVPAQASTAQQARWRRNAVRILSSRRRESHGGFRG
jgi:hypothetical protein